MYRVQLQNFEGPLDLLLFFIKRDELDIYDISGKLVESHYVNANKININTSKLNSGIYFIEIKSDVSKIKKKVIIN